MAIIRGAVPGKPLDARSMSKAVVGHFDPYRSLIVPNVMILGCEMDLAVLTKANYLTEVEIKISLSDWNADRHKAKWQNSNRSRYVDRFFYAVPTELAAKRPDWVPEEAGIIVVRDRHAFVAREAKKMGAEKLPNTYRQRMLGSMYHRFWNSRNLVIEEGLNLDVVLGES